MKLPFVIVRREEHEDLQNGYDDAAAHYDIAVERIDEVRRENEQLKQQLADLSAASVVAEGLKAVAAAIVAAAEAHGLAVKAAAAQVAHATGAAALAHNKNADVNREWLEVTKNNR